LVSSVDMNTPATLVDSPGTARETPTTTF